MNVKTLTATILGNLSEVGKWQSDFLQENFDLQCRIRGRHNFVHLSRYSGLNSGTFHNNYTTDFDFLDFNRHLVE